MYQYLLSPYYANKIMTDYQWQNQYFPVKMCNCIVDFRENNLTIGNLWTYIKKVKKPTWRSFLCCCFYFLFRSCHSIHTHSALFHQICFMGR